MNYFEKNYHQKIPKIIWQTHKKDPPVSFKTNIFSWINLNPSYQWMYMDDESCLKFIQENFSLEFSNLYKSLPIPVMKADVWRVAVVYAYGGIYSDLDCFCIKPIETWLNSNDELIVGVEVENGALLNYVFAAKPKHPALLNVLNTFVDYYKSSNFMDKNSPTPVQDFGQGGFSDGILRYYNLNTKEFMSKGGTSNFYNENKLVKEENTKFILKQSNIFSHHKQTETCVYHQAASFKRSNRDSWRNQQKKYMENK